MKNVARHFDEGQMCNMSMEYTDEVFKRVNDCIYPIFDAIVVSFFTELEIAIRLRNT